MHDGRCLVFASEVKALFADPSVPREHRPGRARPDVHLLVDGAAADDLRGIEQLPARPRRGAGPRRRAGRRPYWSLSFPDRGREVGQDTVENAAELRDRLVEATRLRFLRSRRPGGRLPLRWHRLLGDGGRDRSLHRARPLHTFSVRFDDGEFDEGDYQQKMAAELGTEHQDIVVSHADIGRVFPASRLAHRDSDPAVRARSAVPALQARPRQRLQGRGDRRGRRRGARRLRHLPRGAGAPLLVARPGVAQAGPRRGAALPVDGALARPDAGLRPQRSSGRTSTPTTRRSRTGPAGTRPPR